MCMLFFQSESTTMETANGNNKQKGKQTSNGESLYYQISTCTRTVSENYNVLDENLRHLQLKAYFCLCDAEENQVPKLGRCGQLIFSFCEI